MKKKMLLIVSILLSLLLSQCNKSEFDVTSANTTEQEVDFPEHIKEFGKAVAKELHGTVINLHKMGVDYSNANETRAFKEEFYKKFYQASPTIIKTKSSSDVLQTQMSSQEFFEKVNSLTSIQVKFINRIIKACERSTSYADLTNRLLKINKEIYSTVPNIQQERLLTVTAVLYYGVKEIQYLEEQGLMPATPQNKIQYITLKTRSEPGGLGDTCRKFLATTWAIAVGEPTPVGEIVASVATVIVGGILLYEVVVCAKKAVDCVGKYTDCVQGGKLPQWQCYDCFRYCEGQNVWDCPRPY